MSGDADVACLRRFYTTCPAAIADTTASWDGVAGWADAEWEEKCGKIIGSYKKKAEKKLLISRIVRKEQESGTLVDAKVEERRAELDAMSTKKRSKLVASLGMSDVRDDVEEAALHEDLRELMYGEITAKYGVDPREMQNAQVAAAVETTTGNDLEAEAEAEAEADDVEHAEPAEAVEAADAEAVPDAPATPAAAGVEASDAGQLQAEQAEQAAAQQEAKAAEAAKAAAVEVQPKRQPQPKRPQPKRPRSKRRRQRRGNRPSVRQPRRRRSERPKLLQQRLQQRQQQRLQQRLQQRQQQRLQQRQQQRQRHRQQPRRRGEKLKPLQKR